MLDEHYEKYRGGYMRNSFELLKIITAIHIEFLQLSIKAQSDIEFYRCALRYSRKLLVTVDHFLATKRKEG